MSMQTLYNSALIIVHSRWSFTKWNALKITSYLPVYCSWYTLVIPINKHSIYASKYKWVANGLEKYGLIFFIDCTCLRESNYFRFSGRTGCWIILNRQKWPVPMNANMDINKGTATKIIQTEIWDCCRVSIWKNQNHLPSAKSVLFFKLFRKSF